MPGPKNDLPKPADENYIGYDRDTKPINRDNDKYNKWKQSLPKHCFYCYHYLECSPTKQCLHNPNYKNLK